MESLTSDIMDDHEIELPDGVKKTLKRYLCILRNEELPLFLLCRSVEVEQKKDINDMLEEHDEKIKELEWMKEQSLRAEDLKKVKYSLLDLKGNIAEKFIESCNFCERKCKVNRKEGRVGFCRVGYESRVAAAFSHMGEEIEFIPSGTIFFSGCNSQCIFCQNWDISQNAAAGEVWSPKKIAEWLNYKFGAKSIINANLVGGEPTPNIHNILKALRFVNVNIPIIWNSNMYMSEEGMNLLHGVVDVYLSDFKYGNDECAKKLSNLPNYTRVVKRNHLIARKQTEMLIRHLVMPNHIECDSKPILKWIKENLGENVIVNIMSQYRPEYKAYEIPEINRKLYPTEYKEVLNYSKKIGCGI